MVKIVEIQKAVVEHFKNNVSGYEDLTMFQLLGGNRTRKLCTPRHIAMYLSRKMTKKSYPVIAREFAYMNHTSIIHGVFRTAFELSNGNQIYKDACERIGCKTFTEKNSTIRNPVSHIEANNGI